MFKEPCEGDKVSDEDRSGTSLKFLNDLKTGETDSNIRATNFHCAIISVAT